MERLDEIKRNILDLVEEYYLKAHQRKPFVPGETRINYSGRVYDSLEMVNLVSSSLDFWLTAGPYAKKLETELRYFFGSADFVLVNSGSSANLLMVATLCARGLAGHPRVLAPGDEIITPVVTFPTTLTPILQNGLVPVFLDCEVGTYNLNPSLLEEAVGPRTKAVLAPHTLGNPCDMATIMKVAERHDLWVLEDGCDALGATFDGRKVGTFGAMSSLSFYPAHHMTMGEGGGIAINDPALKMIVHSLRDWGRDCWCEPGRSNTCGKRFDWQLGDLPYGYDHKYIYSNQGYNLKVTDMQAAIGLAQLEKVPQFIERRRHNFDRLLEAFRQLEDRIVLPVVHPLANPSPFGFPLTVKKAGLRQELIRHLEEANIETRLIFGGNILRQPGFQGIPCRVHGELTESDRIMRDTLFVGVYPGLTDEMVDYVAERVQAFFKMN
jgi:CDP-4-dehydro-6-deoxyglucose reductase, E1